MRGLTIILAGPERLEASLTVAMATAALGGRARVFALGQAVIALARGHPLIGEALDIGVELLACQTGLADLKLDFSTLDPRIEAAGPVSVMQTLGEDRLLLA